MDDITRQYVMNEIDNLMFRAIIQNLQRHLFQNATFNYIYIYNNNFHHYLNVQHSVIHRNNLHTILQHSLITSIPTILQLNRK